MSNDNTTRLTHEELNDPAVDAALAEQERARTVSMPDSQRGWARMAKRMGGLWLPLLALCLVGTIVVWGSFRAVVSLTSPKDTQIRIGSSLYTLTKEAQQYLHVSETSDYEAARSVLIIEEPHYSLEGQVALCRGLEIFFRDNPQLAEKTEFLSEGVAAGQPVSVDPLIDVEPDPTDEMVRQVLSTFLIPGYMAYDWKQGNTIPIIGIEDGDLYELSAGLWVDLQGKQQDTDLARLWDFTVTGRNKRISATLIGQSQKFENPVLFVGSLHMHQQDAYNFEVCKSGTIQSRIGLGAECPTSQIANAGIYDYLKEAGIGYTFLTAAPQQDESAETVNKSQETYAKLMSAQKTGDYNGYIHGLLNSEQLVYAVTVKPSPAAAAQYLAVSIRDLLNKIQDLVNKIKANNGKPPDGYVGGEPFENRENRLPQGKKYKEYDINPGVKGPNRGQERIVISDDGSVYYTSDHYKHFM